MPMCFVHVPPCVPQGDGPLAEIEFWRERASVYSTLLEQLNKAKVKRVVEILRLVESPMIVSFDYHRSDLGKQQVV